MVLRRADGQETVLDEGQRYQGPDISRDSRSVTYYLSSGDIFYCDLGSGPARKRCNRVWIDQGLAAGPPPRISPTGDTLAYVATDERKFFGTLFLRLLSLSTHRVRDVSRLDVQCRPCYLRWISNDRLRICGQKGKFAAEMNISTGRKYPSRASLDSGEACRDSGAPSEGRFVQRRRDSFDVRFVSDSKLE